MKLFNNPVVKEVIPHTLLFFAGIATLIFCYKLAGGLNADTPDEQMHVLRIFVAFGAAAISIALPGFIEVGNNALKTAEDKSTMSLNLKAGGALAIFVLVYLVQPIGG
ncbi:hypothetical protein [Gilvibacter sp.]|uniref:hypothetical protein n=1 Tax=Gilvibacter sp. TaxID=2729997 RepID=UPI003F4A5067